MSTRTLSLLINKPAFVRMFIKSQISPVKWKESDVNLQPKIQDTSKLNPVSIRNIATCGGSAAQYHRHNYDPKLENLINCQIISEFTVGYAYMNMATYYGRSNVALPGLYGYFMKMFYEELEHGLGFIKYQNMRGGEVKFSPLRPTDVTEWDDIAHTFKCALDMEKCVKDSLLKIHKTAGELHDTDLQNFLDDYILNQEKSIQEMARYFTRITQLAKTELGRYLFDCELHHTHVRKLKIKHEPESGYEYYM